MTNVRHLRNSTPEDEIKDYSDELKRLETERSQGHDRVDAQYYARCREVHLGIGAVANKLRAKFPGKSGDRDFGEAWEGMCNNLLHINRPTRSANMWADALPADELAAYEAAHPGIRVDGNSGFRLLRQAVEKGKTAKQKPKRETKMSRTIEIVQEKFDNGDPVMSKKLAKEIGVSNLTVDSAVQRVKGRIEGRADVKPAPIDVSTLSITAQERLEAAKRQEIKKMRDDFDKLVRTRVSEEIANIIQNRLVGIYQKKFDHAEKVVASYKGAMTKKEYNMVRSCLHPDSRASVSDERLAEAFNVFSKAEIALLPAVDTAPDCPPAPVDLSDYLKRKD